MKNPIHSSGSTGKNNRRRGSANGNTTFANTSAQETKDGPKQYDSGKRRVEADRNLEGA